MTTNFKFWLRQLKITKLFLTSSVDSSAMVYSKCFLFRNALGFDFWNVCSIKLFSSEKMESFWLCFVFSILSLWQLTHWVSNGHNHATFRFSQLFLHESRNLSTNIPKLRTDFWVNCLSVCLFDQRSVNKNFKCKKMKLFKKKNCHHVHTNFQALKPGLMFTKLCSSLGTMAVISAHN